MAGTNEETKEWTSARLRRSISIPLRIAAIQRSTTVTEMLEEAVREWAAKNNISLPRPEKIAS